MSSAIVVLIVFWLAIILGGAYIAYVSWMANEKISNVIKIVVVCIIILVICTYLYVKVNGL